jgi:acid phosphatase (class A)
VSRAASRMLALTASVAAVLLAAACSSAAPARPTTLELEEIRPGVAKGYLRADQLPDSAALLPPPPATGSAAQAVDDQLSLARTVRGTPRWEQAIVDSNVQFPAAASIFACAIGTDITEANAPRLYAMLRRSRTDAAAVSDAAKDKHKRPRPFTVNGEATCTPEKEAGLARNGSYPSGHTSIGAAWALILAELAPDRADAVLARGTSYGQSRMVCNVHWQSVSPLGARWAQRWLPACMAMPSSVPTWTLPASSWRSCARPVHRYSSATVQPKPQHWPHRCRSPRRKPLSLQAS